jgi:hypothetical protein
LATTKVGDEFKMDFISNIVKHCSRLFSLWLSFFQDDDTLVDTVIKILGIQCRRCKGGHLSVKCPHKDYLQERVPLINDSPSKENDNESSTKKYIPPGKRSSGSSMNDLKKQGTMNRTFFSIISMS